MWGCHCGASPHTPSRSSCRHCGASPHTPSGAHEARSAAAAGVGSSGLRAEQASVRGAPPHTPPRPTPVPRRGVSRVSIVQPRNPTFSVDPTLSWANSKAACLRSRSFRVRVPGRATAFSSNSRMSGSEPEGRGATPREAVRSRGPTDTTPLCEGGNPGATPGEGTLGGGASAPQPDNEDP